MATRVWKNRSAVHLSFTTALMKRYDIHTYTELRQQIHDDLRIQHPEWVQPNGESPICDSYEVRLMKLLADPAAVQAASTPNAP